MSKFLSINFEGNYSNIKNFFLNKGWELDTKQISPSKLYARVSSEDLVEEIKFFSNMDLDDQFNVKMTKVDVISEDEYKNTAENGFEIINHSENKLISEVTQPIKSLDNVQEEKVVPKSNVNVQNVSSSNTGGNVNVCEVTGPSINEDPKSFVARVLNDTVLPSKSPLPQEDAFAYLTSPGYIRNFMIASVVVLFVLAILD
jgi:hypothetical protein